MTARPIKAIDELNRRSLLDTKQNRNFTHTEILQSMNSLLHRCSRKQERDEYQIPIFWLPDFDQSVNSRKNSMGTGERTRSGTGSGEAE
jgi:hypothetical protein